MLFEKRIDTLRNPRNGQTFDRLVLESVDWVNVVALDPAGRSLMIRQFRFGVGYNTWKPRRNGRSGRGQQNGSCPGVTRGNRYLATIGTIWGQ